MTGVFAALVRPATAADTVGGVPARLVAAPSSTAEAAALIAATPDLAVVVRGNGTTLDWGMPPRRLDLIIDTHRLTGVVEHAAGDLITVVRAGTRLDAMDLPGQQLAVDAPPGATVGGTVAADRSGPRRTLYGTVRDLLIGITVVRPDGTVAHAGGKVVKNVAGYDLGKLFTGSYGTLGLITECAFRLHPLPAAAAVVRAAAASPAEAGRLVAAVRAAQIVPSAIEVDAPPGGGVEVAVLVEGSAAGVRARADALRTLLGPGAADGAPPWWGRLPWRPGDVGLKLGVPLSQVPALIVAAREAGGGVTVRGSAGSGVVYAGFALSTCTHEPAGGSGLALSTHMHGPAGGSGLALSTHTHGPAGGPGLALSTHTHGRAGLADEGPGIGPREEEGAGGSADRGAEGGGSAGGGTGGGSPGGGTGGGGSADGRPGSGADLSGAPRPPHAYRCSEQSAGEAARVVERLRAAAVRAGGHAVVLTAPEEVRRVVDMWGPVGGLALMRRVKDRFDPDHRFAPGRFVGGI